MRARILIAGLALSAVVVASENGWPQAVPPMPIVQSPTQQPPPAPSQEPQIAVPPAPVERENPGLINEIGKLFEKSKTMPPPISSPGEALNGLPSIAPPSSMVTGHAACVVAANGAPDCKTRADRLCQSKGFREGSSLDTDAVEKCSPIVYLPGHKRGQNDCKTENFVTRALCQ